MKFSVKMLSLAKIETEAMAVFLWQNEQDWPRETLWLNDALDGFLKKIIEEEEFKAEEGKILAFHTHGKIKPSRVLIVGLGKKEELDLARVRKIFALLGKKAKDLKIKTLGLSLSFGKDTKLDFSQFAQGASEGLLLGTYKFLKYKGEKEKEEKQLESIEIAVEKAADLVHIKEGVSRGELFSQATIFARDLVNEPSSVTTPNYLAEVARKLAGEEIKCQIYDQKQMEKMGLGGVLGVARGSDEPPKFIRLEYKPRALRPASQRGEQVPFGKTQDKQGKDKKVVLVGKAITFDTGGLSLKPSSAMETMKLDMAGGAAVLGVFSVLVKLKPKSWVVGLIPATENMPSGRAIKPGDILKARNGKTIEVANTDAEGRLILADALSLGAEEKPDLLLDLATLTGACMVALGEEIAGLFSASEVWVKRIKQSADDMGETVWQLPLTKEYKDLIKSEIADIKNTSKSRYGGAITAALFLQEFVGNAPWVHLDIAGPAYAEKETALVPQGGSGFGVRTILNLLQQL